MAMIICLPVLSMTAPTLLVAEMKLSQRSHSPRNLNCFLTVPLQEIQHACSVASAMSSSMRSYDGSRRVSLSMGFSRQKILEWVATLSSRGSSQPRDERASFTSPTPDIILINLVLFCF